MSPPPAALFARRSFLALGLLAVSTPLAQARVGVFFGFGGPIFYPPPPYYYPPPVYYAPPPVVYAPPAWTPPPPSGSAQSCYAGRYVCPMTHPVPTGATCWCSNNSGGQAYGTAN
jgi:hypothetical protein